MNFESSDDRAPAGFAAVALAVLAAAVSAPLSAQLANDEAPIVVGHYHLNATDLDEHRRFWVETLGGEVVDAGDHGDLAIRFPDVFLFLDRRAPTGPTRGTTFDHIGFAVPDVPAMAARVVDHGYARTVGREPGPGQQQEPPTAGEYGRFEYLVGPDGVKIELVTNESADPEPIRHHHAHFVNRRFVEMQQWYMRAFDATLRPGQTDFFIGADLPGVGYMLNFFSWLPAEELSGTRGRAVDHVGFEVRDLDRYCDGAQGRGVTLTVACRREGGLTIAETTDPFGTVIELTEGLRAIY